MYKEQIQVLMSNRIILRMIKKKIEKLFMYYFGAQSNQNFSIEHRA